MRYLDAAELPCIATGPEGVAISVGLWAQFQTKPAVRDRGDQAHRDANLQQLLVYVGIGYARFAMVGPGVGDTWGPRPASPSSSCRSSAVETSNVD